MAQRTTTSPTGEHRLAMSYEDYLAWADEDTHAEWVDGEVIVFMPPTDRHQDIIGFLDTLLRLFTELFDLGVVRVAPFEMRARPGGPAREPDLLFVAREHLDRLTPRRLAGPADLVVEVVSPDSATRDRTEKFAEYQAMGVREYWIFDPRSGQEGAFFYRLTADGAYEPIPPDADGRYHSTVLPGFWLRPDWLWQEPLPGALTTLAAIAPDALRGALPDPGAEGAR